MNGLRTPAGTINIIGIDLKSVHLNFQVFLRHLKSALPVGSEEYPIGWWSSSVPYDLKSVYCFEKCHWIYGGTFIFPLVHY